MTGYLALMYLLSLALGYAAAFDCSTKELWRAVRDSYMPDTLKLALNPRGQRTLVRGTCLASVLGMGYGVWNFGFLAGGGVLFCFIAVSKTAEMFFLHRIHSSSHLNIILRAVLRRQADYIRAGDMDRAKSLECLINKVALKLYAVKAVKSAGLVPAYGGELEHLKEPGARADNYQRCTRSRRGN